MRGDSAVLASVLPAAFAIWSVTPNKALLFAAELLDGAANWAGAQVSQCLAQRSTVTSSARALSTARALHSVA